MHDTLGIVELFAAPGGAALQRLAGRRLGGASLLQWVVRRVSDSQRLDRVLLITDGSVQQQRLAELTPSDVRVFVADQPDGLSRVAAAMRKHPSEAIVRVGVANPFVDPVLIDSLVNSTRANPGCDYASYCFGDGRPAVLSKIGVFAEWCRSEAIFRADREAKDPTERQHATRYIFSHPELFQLRLLPSPPELDRDDLRLTIDVEEDWDHAQLIFDALGPDRIEWQRIAGLVDQQPDLRKRMAVLNRTAQPTAPTL